MPDNLSPLPAANLAGSLDLSFGIGGKVVTSIDNSFSYANSVAIDASDRIVMAGFAGVGSYVIDNFALARYTNTGVLDSSFGTNGIITSPIGGSNAHASSVAIDTNGRIVVAGYAVNGTIYDSTLNVYQPRYNFAVARYTSSGVLDSTFGTDGKVLSPFGFGSSIAIDTSGRIVVAGSGSALTHYTNIGILDTSFGTGSGFALTRYTDSGILDTSFGTGGLAVSPIGSDIASANSIAIEASGKIIVAGYADNGSGYSDFALARYTSSGSLDSSFGTNGRVITSIGSIATELPDSSTIKSNGTSVVIDADGRIVVGGFAYNADNYDFALARYTNAGSLDNTFGTGGTVLSSVNMNPTNNLLYPLSNDFGRSVTIDASGRIVLVGRSSYNGGGYSDFALARYTSIGTLDSSFGIGGTVHTPISGEYGYGGDSANDVAIDSNGQIIVAGAARSNGYAFALARYNGGPNDFTFKADTFTRNATTQAVENFYIDPATQQQARRDLTYGNSFGALAGQTIKLGSDWTIAAVVDFNRDSIDDILLHNQSGDEVKLWTIGPNTQVTAIQSIVGQDGNTLKTGNTNWKVVGCADADGDNILDIVWHNQKSDEVAFWFMANDGKTVKTYDYLRNSDGTITKTDNPLWQIAAVADFDRDGNIDLLFRLPELNQTAIVRTSGRTTVDAQYITANVDTTLTIRGVADSNGDRVPEIYWQSQDKRQVLMQAVKFQAGKWLADDFAIANPIVPVTVAA